MSRKEIAPAPSVADIGAALEHRYEPAPETPAPRRASRPPKPTMTRRSWLLPTEVADALAAAADRIHHGTHGRVTKSRAQAALIRAGLEHEQEITDALGDTDSTDSTSRT